MYCPALTVHLVQIRIFLVSLVVKSWRDRPSRCRLANGGLRAIGKKVPAVGKNKFLALHHRHLFLSSAPITGARGSRQEIANDAYRTGGAFD
jgi:hypothetical protein